MSGPITRFGNFSLFSLRFSDCNIYKISVQQMVIMSSSAGHMHAYFKEYLYYCDFHLKVYIATHGFTYI